MKAVFDTNILIDQLNGVAQAAAVWAAYVDRVINRVTCMEVLAGASTSMQEEQDARALLGSFRIVELDAVLAESVVTLRKAHHKKIKLPDAIIYATAKREACSLITRNTKDFGSAAGDVIEPYVLP